MRTPHPRAEIIQARFRVKLTAGEKRGHPDGRRGPRRSRRGIEFRLAMRTVPILFHQRTRAVEDPVRGILPVLDRVMVRARGIPADQLINILAPDEIAGHGRTWGMPPLFDDLISGQEIIHFLARGDRLLPDPPAEGIVGVLAQEVVRGFFAHGHELVGDVPLVKL